MRKPSLDALAAAHDERLRKLDATLPARGPLAHTADARVILAAAGASSAAGASRTYLLDPASFESCHAALRQHSLDVRITGPDQAAALNALLSAWRDELADDDPTEIETAASITWPSRDTAAVPALYEHGFVPMAALAVRTRTTPESPKPSQPVRLRSAGPADLDSAVALQMEELRFDEQFGVSTIRAETENAVRTRLRESLAAENGTRILAERGARQLGLVVLDLPPDTSWLGSMVKARRIGYIECLSVHADVRGQGIGRTLADAAHRRLHEAAVDSALLHYALANARSSTFWQAMGYRPLWYHWTARPSTSMFTAPPHPRS